METYTHTRTFSKVGCGSHYIWMCRTPIDRKHSRSRSRSVSRRKDSPDAAEHSDNWAPHSLHCFFSLCLPWAGRMSCKMQHDVTPSVKDKFCSSLVFYFVTNESSNQDSALWFQHIKSQQFFYFYCKCNTPLAFIALLCELLFHHHCDRHCFMSSLAYLSISIL